MFLFVCLQFCGCSTDNIGVFGTFGCKTLAIMLICIGDGIRDSLDKESADLGIQVSYIASTYYFTGYTQPEWWWGYPGYWGPSYWGNWGGWYYPYAVTYSYSTNSFITEMVNLKADEGEGKKLPVVWTSYLTGFETGSKAINRTLAIEAVNQSFTQSPYLTNK